MPIIITESQLYILFVFFGLMLLATPTIAKICVVDMCDMYLYESMYCCGTWAR